jgi:hypothetical protein
MIIDDGTGSGTRAQVDSENRLRTFSVIEGEDRHVNREGKVWSIYAEVTAAGANDYFFYLKNTGSALLGITDIRISSSVATRLDYDFVTGTPTYVTGTDCEITSRQFGSSRTPDIVTKYDTDITNLSKEGTIFFEQCAVADTRYKLTTTSSIMLLQGQAIAFKRVAATGAVTAIVSLVEFDA